MFNSRFCSTFDACFHLCNFTTARLRMRRCMEKIVVCSQIVDWSTAFGCKHKSRTVILSQSLVMIGWCTDLARWSRRRTAKGASWNIGSSQRMRACMQCTFWAWAGGHQMSWSRQRCNGQVYRGIRRGKVWLAWSLVVIRVFVCSIFKRLLCYLMKMVKITIFRFGVFYSW